MATPHPTLQPEARCHGNLSVPSKPHSTDRRRHKQTANRNLYTSFVFVLNKHNLRRLNKHQLYPRDLSFLRMSIGPWGSENRG